MTKINGVDLSGNNAGVDYAKLAKCGYDFAIIKIGQRWVEATHAKTAAFKSSGFDGHYRGCKSAGLKVGAYVFATAVNVVEAREEAREAVAALKGYTLDCPYIWYDMEAERNAKLGKTLNTNMFYAFADEVAKAGYKCGLYANANWLRNYLDAIEIQNRAHKIWLAAWTDSPDKLSKYIYDNQVLWQWGVIEPDGGGFKPGLSSKPSAKALDANVCYDAGIFGFPTKTADELAREVIAGRWGNAPDREQRLTAAGYDYKAVQAEVNRMLR